MLNCPILTRRYLTQPPTVLFKSNKDINMTNRLVSTALSVSQPQAQLVVSLSPQPVSASIRSRVLNSLRGLPPAICNHCPKILRMRATNILHNARRLFNPGRDFLGGKFDFIILHWLLFKWITIWHEIKIDFKLRSPSFYNDLGQAVIFTNWHWYKQPWNNEEQWRLNGTF